MLRWTAASPGCFSIHAPARERPHQRKSIQPNAARATTCECRRSVAARRITFEITGRMSRQSNELWACEPPTRKAAATGSRPLRR